MSKPNRYIGWPEYSNMWLNRYIDLTGIWFVSLNRNIGLTGWKG